VLRPPPAGLQGEPAYLSAADLQQIQPAVLELARLVGCGEALLFCRDGHGMPPPGRCLSDLRTSLTWAGCSFIAPGPVWR